jgi:hypothetical protein
MLSRDTARVLCQPVCSKDFSANRADEASLRTIRTTEKIEKSVRGATGRSYSCHVLLKVSKTCRLLLQFLQLSERRDDECPCGVGVELSMHVNQATFCGR